MNKNVNLICVFSVFVLLVLGCANLKSKAEIEREKRLEKITKRSNLFEGKPELLAEFGQIPTKENIKQGNEFKGKILMLRKLPDQEKLSVFPFQYEFTEDFLANNLDEVGTVILEVLEDGSSAAEVLNSSKSPTGIKKETTKTTKNYGWNVYFIDRAENTVVYKTFIAAHSNITTKIVNGKSKVSFSGGDELENFYKKIFLK
jgi:hypothetical protein